MILDVQNITQSFPQGFWMRQKQVLFDVNLQVPEKSIFGFLGANGAGKTTLIHLITGLKKPKSGKIKIGGIDISQDPENAKRKLGYLPERPYFYEHLTGDEFLTYLGTLSQMPKVKIKARIPEVLQTVGMRDARHKELKNYSKGMLQRIGIAQSILHEPELLILDEPMSGLDPVGRREIRELMIDLAKKGHTVFFSTHVIPDAEAICDEVAIIQHGKMIGSGPLKQFLAQESQTVEIAVAQVDAQKLEKITYLKDLRKIPEGYRARITGRENQDQVVKDLVSVNAQILWIIPERVSLERFFERKEDANANA